MTYFIIVRKSDFAVLPSPTGRGAATHVEPSKDKPPRLFKSLGLARRFLTLWAKGPLVTNVVYRDEGFGEVRENRGWKSNPVPRSIDDLVIEEVTLRTKYRCASPLPSKKQS